MGGVLPLLSKDLGFECSQREILAYSGDLLVLFIPRNASRWTFQIVSVSTQGGGGGVRGARRGIDRKQRVVL